MIQTGGRFRGWWSITLLAVTILDAYLVFRVGQAVGFLWLLAILAAQVVLGAWLIRRSGSRARRALEEAMRGGTLPTGAVYNALATLVGGMLIMVPGFISTVVGLILVLPPTRRLTRALLGWFTARAGIDTVTTSFRGPEVIEGEVVTVTDPGSDGANSSDAREPKVIEGRVIEGRIIE